MQAQCIAKQRAELKEKRQKFPWREKRNANKLWLLSQQIAGIFENGKGIIKWGWKMKAVLLCPILFVLVGLDANTLPPAILDNFQRASELGVELLLLIFYWLLVFAFGAVMIAITAGTFVSAIIVALSPFILVWFIVKAIPIIVQGKDSRAAAAKKELDRQKAILEGRIPRTKL